MQPKLFLCRREWVLAAILVVALMSPSASASIRISVERDLTVSIAGQPFGYQLVRYESPLSTPQNPRFTRYHLIVVGGRVINLSYRPHLMWVMISVSGILLLVFLVWTGYTSKQRDPVSESK